MFATEMTRLVEWGDTIIRVNFWVIAFVVMALLIYVARND